jgi:tetratricopeptide (TPR) repeat protein
MILPALAAALALSVQAAEAPVSARARADVHFLSGFDHFRAGRAEDARREWKACRELDETHDFCEFGLSVLDAGAPKTGPAAEEEPKAVTAAPPAVDSSRDSQQAYLEGVIYYQKGDYEKARAAWRKAKELAPPGSDAAKDASTGLDRINKLYGDTPDTGDNAPKTLKQAPEKKDEHEALQTYFTGLIYFQKGDLARARVEWTRAKALAPEDSSVMSDSKAALEKLDKEEASTRGDRKK